MLSHQLAFPLTITPEKKQVKTTLNGTYVRQLVEALSQDLGFHGENTGYATHNFHSFPAKFPPQLPDKFITALTVPGDVVLDPMSGSGTTVVEGFLHGRRAIACDIDPLALRIVRTKVTPLDLTEVLNAGQQILAAARESLAQKALQVEHFLDRRWDEKTKAFIDYWFAPQTQRELAALVIEIEQISNPDLRAFFELAFSAIIITKSGGVSLAFDLAHTRPHRAKQVFSPTGEMLYAVDSDTISDHRRQVLTKTLRPAVDEFEKRIRRNLEGLLTQQQSRLLPQIIHGNAQTLPLPAGFVDLIVTSPPYASNAIDYMRAHKFSLVWFGYPIDDLGEKRRTYIGGESLGDVELVPLPEYTAQVVTDVSRLDTRKGLTLHRYYSEMNRVLVEMYRVLKPGKAAIVVVGTSILRGRDTETQTCLADIGRSIGFDVPRIGVRYLDRNRRMMPAGTSIDRSSQIQQRMHEEYVIGFYKPES
jgi:DNA modification methylase